MATMPDDKPRRFTVQVTTQDIERAVRKHSGKCAVAIALARVRPGAHHIEVDIQTIRFTDEDGRRWSWQTPWQAAQYVVDFDAGDDIAPFSFRLDPARAIEIKRRVRTPEGKEAHVAAQRARRASKPAKAKPRRRAASGTQSTFEGGDGARAKAPPRVYKTSRRMYGHRHLRINKARVDAV
jgi:hypothetical protein